MDIDLVSIESESIDVPIEEGGATTRSSQGQSQLSERKRKKTSHVWRYFTELPIGNDEIAKAECNKCGTTYNSSTKCGTGSMLKHLQGCLIYSDQDITQLFLSHKNSAFCTSWR